MVGKWDLESLQVAGGKTTRDGEFCNADVAHSVSGKFDVMYLIHEGELTQNLLVVRSLILLFKDIPREIRRFIDPDNQSIGWLSADTLHLDNLRICTSF